jgi:hypothetical protein
LSAEFQKVILCVNLGSHPLASVKCSCSGCGKLLALCADNALAVETQNMRPICSECALPFLADASEVRGLIQGETFTDLRKAFARCRELDDQGNQSH